jgi:hypothetical protein
MDNDFKVHAKKFNLIIKFYKLYIFGLLIFFQFNFHIKIHFVIVLVSNLREKKKRMPDSYNKERKILFAMI